MDDKTKKKDANSGKADEKKEDEENNVENKCRIAVQKVRSIFAYAKDYKIIMEQYNKKLGATQPKAVWKIKG